MGPKQLSLSETARRAVKARQETLYRTAKDSGVDYTNLHRFMKQRRPITLASFEKLCAYLGLKLVADEKGK
jgi:hypothetical protein